MAVSAVIHAKDILSIAPVIQKLASENWEETGFGYDLDINFDQYQALSDREFVRGYLATVDDEPIGYAIAIYAPSEWNKNVTICSVNVLYIKPEYRGSFVAGKMLLTIEHDAKKRNAQRLDFMVRAGDQPFGLENRGFCALGTTYGKTLKE